MRFWIASHSISRFRHPVDPLDPVITRRGLVLGGGQVIPELNFTLPTMLVTEGTMPEVRQHYRQIITGALQRAVELDAPGLVVEFETLPPMTENPAWGVELTRILAEQVVNVTSRPGLRSAVTSLAAFGETVV